MIEALVGRFRTRIDLFVAPTSIRLRCMDDDAKVAPSPRVAEDGKLCAIGMAAQQDGDGRRVDIFETPHRKGSEWSARKEATTLLRYLFVLHMPTTLFRVAPIVTVHGASSLRELLDGCQAELLTECIMGAGASSVGFVDDALPNVSQ